MSFRAHGHLKHKLVPVKMHFPVAHSSRRHLTPRAPPSLHSPLVMRDIPGAPTNGPDALNPTAIIGISISAAAVVGLGVLMFVHWYRKRARAARTIERGMSVARASLSAHGKPEMRRAWGEGTGGDASDDTHVVDFVYGEKVKGSFEASDYNALSSNPKAVSRAAMTASVILPASAIVRPAPKLKAIDTQRANHPLSAAPTSSPLVAPVPPALFPATPSSVHLFYGPAISRTRPDSNAGSVSQDEGLATASAMRALAVAAGVVPPSQDERADTKGGTELPMYFSFRESTFGDGMKLGEHLGIQVQDQPESVRSQDSTRGSHVDESAGVPVKQPSSVPSPGARPGTAGTFGQPVGAFGGARIPYRAAGHRHAASSLSIADVRSVRVSYASGHSSPLSAGFRGHSPKPSISHGRTQSSGSAMGVSTRKVLTVFPPLLPDELVLGLGEKVTLLQTFDDEWCVVGRDRFGEVEIGAVPSYIFTKAKAGEKFPRPMRSTSLGVQVEMSSAPGAVWSSREEVISWSNF